MLNTSYGIVSDLTNVFSRFQKKFFNNLKSECPLYIASYALRIIVSVIEL